MVNEPLLREIFLDVAQRGFAEGTDLKLNAVEVRKGGRAKLSLPVAPVLAELHVPEGAIIVLPNEAGHRALHGMTDVVDQERVAIGPAVQVANRFQIAGEEGRVESVTGPLLGGNPEAMLDGQESEGSHRQMAPVDPMWLLRRR